MQRLTWTDIFVDWSTLDIGELLALWPHTVTGQLRPIGASVFGDCFFERPAGNVEKLDVLEGGVHFVARDLDEFGKLMNTESWQENALLTHGIALLHERGLHRLENQVFAFSPHPAFTGKIDWGSVMTMDARVWHSICSQVLDGSSQPGGT